MTSKPIAQLLVDLAPDRLPGPLANRLAHGPQARVPASPHHPEGARVGAEGIPIEGSTPAVVATDPPGTDLACPVDLPGARSSRGRGRC